ncbi:winged helix-turn-helix domain-containing protein [Amycolatopsis sp.]|uniref:ArsR/SmtB family transcription factor n=1 Tax=Amycolatopsis sp. TaxID=37632 RepID=UPI002CAA1241|nr:winged helix-turn-helix domain-containing protein [Amycolatopsis sp.]HVV14708.1 winged helix-turn-helix domain-containing protein [Amycolatopsis sp.]
MLRIRFDTQDLGRVRLVREPDPLWEVVLSLPQFADARPRSAAHHAWQAAAWRATAGGLARRARELLSVLVPPKGDFPDFLNPPEARDGLESGLAAIRSLPRATLHADLAAAMRRRASVPGWTKALASADREARSLLELAIREYFRAAIEPHWPVVRRHVMADRAARTRHAAEFGVDGLLSGISPRIRWDWPVLEAEYPCEQSVDLRGRGLVLIPSFFCAGSPVSFIDPELPPVLVYPAAAEGATMLPERDVSALANVLGRTRASILLALERPCSTTELAESIDMSLASASHHVGLLRAAGLAHTARTGTSVRHQLTALGYALLDAPCGRSPFELG